MQLVTYHTPTSLLYFIFLIARVSHVGVGLHWHVCTKEFHNEENFEKIVYNDTYIQIPSFFMNNV
jgi:hypothetical protein